MALVFAIVAATVALAQSARADGGGFGLGVGIVKFSDSDDSDDSPLWLTTNLRMKLNANFAIEPEGGWYRQSEGSFHTDVFNFGGNALLILPSEKFDVFVGGGLGGHYFRFSGAGSSAAETYLGYHALGGIEVKATDSLNFFGAVRYEIVDAGGDSDDQLKAWKIYGGIRFTHN